MYTASVFFAKQNTNIKVNKPPASFVAKYAATARPSATPAAKAICPPNTNAPDTVNAAFIILPLASIRGYSGSMETLETRLVKSPKTAYSLTPSLDAAHDNGDPATWLHFASTSLPATREPHIMVIRMVPDSLFRTDYKQAPRHPAKQQDPQPPHSAPNPLAQPSGQAAEDGTEATGHKFFSSIRCNFQDKRSGRQSYETIPWPWYWERSQSKLQQEHTPPVRASMPAPQRLPIRPYPRAAFPARETSHPAGNAVKQ